MKTTTSPIDNGVVLITGASAGIGQAIAREVAPRARALILVARRRDRLEAFREELRAAHPRLQVELASCDLSALDPAREAIEQAVARTGPVDVLVNNAGLGSQSLFERERWTQLQRMLDLNVQAYLWLLHRFVPEMVARGAGGVLHVGSGAGMEPMVGQATYTGTKHFVHGLARTLRLELAGTGVRSAEVCPGPVDSEFDAVAGMQGAGHGLPPVFRISSEECARESVEGFDLDRAITYPGRAYRLLMWLRPFMPEALASRMGRSIARALRKGEPQERAALASGNRA
jgi:hypothetical protein